ncbi:MAG: hypothetical protein ABEI11_01820 [Haloarculaceae archaeon]
MEYGQAWVYESIIGALPGIDLPRPVAIGIQLALFELATILLAWHYGRWEALAAGTAAVVVAAVGSAEMLRISTLARRAALPPAYYRLLFGSSVEVVLGVLAYVALVTHLFVFDPANATTPLIERLLGPDPPLVGVYVLLLVLWDVCYRIGTGWWASVVALWRSARYRFDPERARLLRRVDLETMAFGLAQLVLVPFLRDHPVLLVTVLGHVAAVVGVTGLSAVLLRVRQTDAERATAL